MKASSEPVRPQVDLISAMAAMHEAVRAVDRATGFEQFTAARVALAKACEVMAFTVAEVVALREKLTRMEKCQQ